MAIEKDKSAGEGNSTDQKPKKTRAPKTTKVKPEVAEAADAVIKKPRAPRKPKVIAAPVVEAPVVAVEPTPVVAVPEVELTLLQRVTNFLVKHFG